MTFLALHWKKFIVAALIIASFALGRWFRPAQMEKSAKTIVVSAGKTTKDSVKETESESAGTRKVVLDFNPNCAPLKTITLKDFAAGAPLPAGIVRATVFEAGPMQVISRTEAQTVRQENRSTQTITLDKPAPPAAQWAVGGGLQLMPGQALQISLERRLFGPIWVTGWALQPFKLAVPSAGVGLRVEF